MFFLQRQPCAGTNNRTAHTFGYNVNSTGTNSRLAYAGTNNRTAHTYGYNVNSALASSTKIISTKQTNVNDSSDL